VSSRLWLVNPGGVHEALVAAARSLSLSPWFQVCLRTVLGRGTRSWRSPTSPITSRSARQRLRTSFRTRSGRELHDGLDPDSPDYPAWPAAFSQVPPLGRRAPLFGMVALATPASRLGEVQSAAASVMPCGRAALRSAAHDTMLVSRDGDDARWWPGCRATMRRAARPSPEWKRTGERRPARRVVGPVRDRSRRVVSAGACSERGCRRRCRRRAGRNRAGRAAP